MPVAARAAYPPRPASLAGLRRQPTTRDGGKCGGVHRALSINPRNAGSHYNLAVVADESGDRTTAIEHYRAFLRLGTVTHGGLAVQVRARLATLGSVGSGL